MYSPIISPADLRSVKYDEILNLITRDNDGIIAEAIDIAVSEVKLYLQRFDPIQLFGDPPGGDPPGLDVAPSFHDANLTRMVKDVALWHIISLGNPNIDYEDIKLRYEQTIKALTRIQEGKSAPLWPYLDTTGADTPPGVAVKVYNSPKRDNRY